MSSSEPERVSFRRLAERFAICRLAANAEIPGWAKGASFASITRTLDELSIVCPLAAIPAEVRADAEWVGFMLVGPFSLTQTGILNSVLEPLARGGIPIFAVSTYDTDYVFVQEHAAERAIETLQAAGHGLIN